MRRDEDRAQAVRLYQDRFLSALDRWRAGQPHEFTLRHDGNRLTVLTAATERVPDSLVPLWVIPAQAHRPLVLPPANTAFIMPVNRPSRRIVQKRAPERADFLGWLEHKGC